MRAIIRSGIIREYSFPCDIQISHFVRRTDLKKFSFLQENCYCSRRFIKIFINISHDKDANSARTIGNLQEIDFCLAVVISRVRHYGESWGERPCSIQRRGTGHIPERRLRRQVKIVLLESGWDLPASINSFHDLPLSATSPRGRSLKRFLRDLSRRRQLPLYYPVNTPRAIVNRWKIYLGAGLHKHLFSSNQ